MKIEELRCPAVADQMKVPEADKEEVRGYLQWRKDSGELWKALTAEIVEMCSSTGLDDKSVRNFVRNGSGGRRVWPQVNEWFIKTRKPLQLGTKQIYMSAIGGTRTIQMYNYSAEAVVYKFFSKSSRLRISPKEGFALGNSNTELNVELKNGKPASHFITMKSGPPIPNR